MLPVGSGDLRAFFDSSAILEVEAVVVVAGRLLMEFRMRSR